MVGPVSASVVALRCRTSDRTPGGARGAEALARRADPNPELAFFLAEVRKRTARGDSITVVLPAVLDRAADAYRYRSMYHLAGRDVFMAGDGASTKWIAAWRVPLDARAEWSGHGGVLVRQR